MNNQNIVTVKSQAALLTARLREFGISIKNTQAIEIASAMADSTDWNRLLARLRNFEEPGILPSFVLKESKILVGVPGIGKTTTLKNIFVREILEGRRVPVFICCAGFESLPTIFSDAPDRGKNFLTIRQENAHGAFVADGCVNSDAQGVILRIEVDQAASYHDQQVARQEGLAYFLAYMDKFIPAQIMSRIGTLMIDEFHLVVTNEFASEALLCILGEVIRRMQRTGAIERLVLSSQLSIFDRQLQKTSMPIKSLFIKGHDHFYQKQQRNDNQESLSSAADVGTLLSTDREVEEIFRKTVNMILSRSK